MFKTTIDCWVSSLCLPSTAWCRALILILTANCRSTWIWYNEIIKCVIACVIAFHKGHCSTSTGISNSVKLNQSLTCKFLNLIVKNVSHGLALLKQPLTFTQLYQII